MANSRLEKAGTIFSRFGSLIKGGAKNKDNVPIWYMLYEAFPPKYEPCFNRRPSEKPIKPIFYPEDEIRAKYHKELNFFRAVSLNSKEMPYTQMFIDMYYQNIENGLDETKAYRKAWTDIIPRFSTTLHDQSL